MSAKLLAWFIDNYAVIKKNAVNLVFWCILERKITNGNNLCGLQTSVFISL